MPQQRATARTVRDDVWDESRDWGFDDRSLRPRSYPRSVAEARARSARRVSGPAAGRLDRQDTDGFDRIDAHQDTGGFDRIEDERHEADRLRYGAPPDGGRRTVVITGRGSERYRPPVSARRPASRVHDRVGVNPDRIAMWAVLLGVVMLLVAAASSHAAVSHGLLASHAAVAHAQHVVAHVLRGR